eukprot:10845631-Alexandrium_andersonii.AAC.1
MHSIDIEADNAGQRWWLSSKGSSVVLVAPGGEGRIREDICRRELGLVSAGIAQMTYFYSIVPLGKPEHFMQPFPVSDDVADQKAEGPCERSLPPGSETSLRPQLPLRVPFRPVARVHHPEAPAD